MASNSVAVEDEQSDKWASDVARVIVPIEIVVDVDRPPTVSSVLMTNGVHPTDIALTEDDIQQPARRNSRLSDPPDPADRDEEDTRNQHMHSSQQEWRETAIRSWAMKWLLAWYVVLFGAFAFVVAILTSPGHPPIHSTSSSAGVSEMEVTLPVVCSLSWDSTELLRRSKASGTWDGTWNICPSTRIPRTAYGDCLFEDMRHFDVSSGSIWVLSELPRGSRWEVVLTGNAANDVSGAVLDQRLLSAPQFEDLDDSLLEDSRRFDQWSPTAELLSTGDAVLVSWRKTAGVCRNSSEITLAGAIEENNAAGIKHADDGTLMFSRDQQTGSSRLQYIDAESCSAVCKCDEPECRYGFHSSQVGISMTSNVRNEAQPASICQCQACTIELGNPKQDPEFLSIQKALQGAQEDASQEESSRGPPPKNEDDQLQAIFGAEEDYVVREALRIWLVSRIDHLRQQLSYRRDGKGVAGHAFAVPRE